MSKTISRWQAGMKDVPGSPDAELMEKITRVGEKGERDGGEGLAQVFRTLTDLLKQAVCASGKKISSYFTYAVYPFVSRSPAGELTSEGAKHSPVTGGVRCLRMVMFHRFEGPADVLITCIVSLHAGTSLVSCMVPPGMGRIMDAVGND